MMKQFTSWDYYKTRWAEALESVKLCKVYLLSDSLPDPFYADDFFRCWNKFHATTAAKSQLRGIAWVV